MEGLRVESSLPSGRIGLTSRPRLKQESFSSTEKPVAGRKSRI